MRQAIMLFALSGIMSWASAENAPVQAPPPTTLPLTQAVNTPPATVPITTPTLRQNTPQTTTLPPQIASLQLKHKQEMEQQNKRLALLEQANQEALAKNQQLQIQNDSLTVQAQVLQSERSAQMFLYGAVTFGAGTLMGIIIYSLLYTRRRRSW